MSGEITPGLEQSQKELDHAIWRELRKPLATAALAGMSFVVGDQIDNSHQPRADALAAEIDTAYGELADQDRPTVDAILDDESAAEGVNPGLVETAKQIENLSSEYRQEEDAGGIWRFMGGVAGIYAFWRGSTLGIARMFLRSKINETHPDLAPERIKNKADRLAQSGHWLDQQDDVDEKYGWKPNQHAQWSRGDLQEIGVDIEQSEAYTLSREGVDTVLCEMLNDAQYEAMLRPANHQESAFAPTMNPVESIQIRVISDLYESTDTFKSLKDWYLYRRTQTVSPGAFTRVDQDKLFLPTLEPQAGGIGVAIGRVTHHWREYLAKQQSDRSEASEAMVLATEGSGVLDLIAPRDDGSNWIDYVNRLVGGRTMDTQTPNEI